MKSKNYIAICNNSLTLKKLAKDFDSRFKAVFETEQSSFPVDCINKRVLEIADISQYSFFLGLFKKVYKMLEKDFMSIGKL